MLPRLGDHNVTIKAGNFLGFSPQQILKINVKPIAPTLSSITDDLTATGVLGTSASINFKISDFVAGIVMLAYIMTHRIRVQWQAIGFIPSLVVVIWVLVPIIYHSLVLRLEQHTISG